MEAKARAAGTSEAVMGVVTTKTFLFACLKKAHLDADLLADVAEACDMNDFTALSLAGGELDAADAADKLFLMQDEAKALLETCKHECLRKGVVFGDGSKYVPRPGDGDPGETLPAIAIWGGQPDPSSQA